MDALGVRAAELGDVDQVVSMYEWLFAPPGARPAQWDAGRADAALRYAVASDDAIVLLAAVDDEFVGFCTAYDDIVSVRFGRRVWVEDLAVHPDRRSLGIGKRLLDEAKDWARARGARHLELDSAETRADAHRFYERERPSWRSICFGWEL
jgi:GNAT superfamily N-acetyltransferase